MFGIDWTETALSGNNKVPYRASYYLILQSYYIYPPPNVPFQACQCKSATSLHRLVVEAKM